MKTIKITEKGQIVIPKEIRKISGFKEGSKICIIVFEDKIELIPLKQISKRMRLTALASEKVLAKDWNSKEDEEAWKDL